MWKAFLLLPVERSEIAAKYRSCFVLHQLRSDLFIFGIGCGKEQMIGCCRQNARFVQGIVRNTLVERRGNRPDNRMAHSVETDGAGFALHAEGAIEPLVVGIVGSKQLAYASLHLFLAFFALSTKVQ